eukprot:scaffold244771_cov26-Tisochrysis_lutea.AAC.2
MGSIPGWVREIGRIPGASRAKMLSRCKSSNGVCMAGLQNGLPKTTGTELVACKLCAAACAGVALTSHSTPAGCSPARRQRSPEASVCPSRSSTPPSLARSGKTCPGLLKSLGPLFGSASARIVLARSAAEMPVEVPSFRSTETVNAVPFGSSLFTTIGGSSSAWQRSSGSETQITPEE